MASRVLATDNITNSNDNQTTDDEKDAQPLVDLESPSEEGHREETSEDDESTS